MQNGIGIWTFILAVGLFASCSDEQGPNKEIAYYLDLAGGPIVNHLYGGGQKPEMQPHSFSYNHHTKSYRIQLRLHWQGPLPHKTGYWAEGTLIVKEPSGEIKWIAKTMSHQLTTFLTKMRMSNGAIGVSNVVVEANSHFNDRR